jgi:hypothetical protein
VIDAKRRLLHGLQCEGNASRRPWRPREHLDRAGVQALGVERRYLTRGLEPGQQLADAAVRPAQHWPTHAEGFQHRAAERLGLA